MHAPTLRGLTWCGYDAAELLEAWGAWAASSPRLGYTRTSEPARAHRRAFIPEDVIAVVDAAATSLKIYQPALFRVLELRCIQGRTCAEVGAILNCSPMQASRLLVLAVKILMAELAGNR